MSQIPPPPPGQPAPIGGTPGAVGGNKSLYTILAWALFPPFGSLVMLFVGKADPDVKYNAAQAVVIHGASFVILVALWILTAIFFPLGILLLIWYFVEFVIWVIGLIMALQSQGARFVFPVLGPMVASFVPAVEAWAK